MDKQSLWDLGLWLSRRYRVATNRLEEAKGVLNSLDLSLADLRKSWAEQVAEQTRPLPSEVARSLLRYLTI